MQLKPPRSTWPRRHGRLTTGAIRLIGGIGLLAGLLIAGCAVPPAPPPTPPAAPTAGPPPVPKRPPRIGLALGGGAARGFAHVGVIQVLEQAGIRPDLVVGTSAGSLVAALYASGMNGARLQRVAMTMEEASFTDWMLPLFSRGMLRGNGLARYVDREVGGKTIEAMPLPLGIVATDLHTGNGILFRRGDTGTAVRASSAVPAIFEPVRISGHDYVDGGLVAPVPVDYARQMGAELVIAVDISSSPQGNPTDDTLQILLQTFTIMGRSINRYQLRDADLVVRPNLAGITSADFAARSQAIAAGREAMQAALPQLRELIAAKSVPESGAATPPDSR
ncbi:MAG: patatin-like phospholipase domain-containing protein [Burkholderiaceae bacterium]|jgi:NTE family protein|nr:MAG: patatin-like phospholipase domain-containing protein [Burkholderiaceae bacterium]